MPRAPRAALLFAAALLCGGLACDDIGVIGHREGAATCEESCPGGWQCHPELMECVECAEDADCDDAAPHCEGFACVECRSAADCPEERPLCAANACTACVEDDDCPEDDTGETELQCEDGACVADDDTEGTEAEAENSGEGSSDAAPLPEPTPAPEPEEEEE